MTGSGTLRTLISTTLTRSSLSILPLMSEQWLSLMVLFEMWRFFGFKEVGGTVLDCQANGEDDGQGES